MMMAFVAIAVISFTSCEKIKGKGEVITESRTVTGYTGIGLAI